MSTVLLVSRAHVTTGHQTSDSEGEVWQTATLWIWASPRLHFEPAALATQACFVDSA